MNPNSPNSLSSLTHTTHTESLATHEENPEDDAPEAVILGGDSHDLDGKKSPGTSEEFDFDEFYQLANRVLNGDSEAMVNLNSLKDRWEQKFKSKNPALKPVTGRPSTPFRPRVSLLPRRSVRTGTDTDLITYPITRPGLGSHGRPSCSGSTFPSQEKEPQETQIPQMTEVPAQLIEDFPELESQDGRQSGPSCNNRGNELQEASTPQDLASPPAVAGTLDESELQASRAEDAQPQDCPPKLDSNPLPTVQDGIPNQSDIYIGNVKLQTEYVDTIAGAFLQSSRKTFLSLRRENGEIVIRPTKEVVDNGSKKWRSTAVGYFLGKRPYFPQVETFVRSNWKGLQHVSVSSSGFFFFRFFSQLAMEDVIEGGPWLVQGQPIVLQPWEQGMSLRRQKHTQIPVWIRLRHLPMEYWTDDGLSTVASGIGTPLYTDGITKDCSRLDFARVCVMLDFNSELPKHLVVISPVLRNGKEDPKRIDVEYEWLPQRCKNCCSLGHVSATCPANRIKTVAPPIQIFVKKQAPQLDSGKPEQSLRGSRPAASSESSGINKGKDIVLYNSYSVLDTDSPKDAERIMDEDNHTMGPNDSSPMAHVQRTRRHLLNNWSWFEDYSGPAGRIWVTWDPLEVDIEILEDGPQHIHCRALNKRLHTRCLITVVYGDYDIIPRRELWSTLRTLSTGILDDPWLILGDFNAVMDDSEGHWSGATAIYWLPLYMAQLQSRSLWKRLDRMLANVAWLDIWPSSSYISALPSTSDHSPLILTGMDRFAEHAIFRFDNYLALQPGFLDSVDSTWKHRISGTAMYDVVCKLKNLKAVFRRQKKLTGDLANNVKRAKIFLDKAQALFDKHKEDIFLHLVKCCRQVYATTVKLEVNMLQQRAKLRWLKHGDQSSKFFFRKINSTRMKQRIFQITKASGEILTAQHDVIQEFTLYFQNLLGGSSNHRILDLRFLRHELKHTITTTEASLLVGPVTHLEVKEAFLI
ncbi:UNVERIFIED_CONTAM: hypothetical protein Scaly_2765700 [Sesamum calycinum]|uniref:DUF4283 domain-containing protein n=1 Tax=Sesamum calycinum TaxID=2727403 RepID=A0AAW2IZ21_9LAMI